MFGEVFRVGCTNQKSTKGNSKKRGGGIRSHINIKKKCLELYCPKVNSNYATHYSMLMLHVKNE